MFFSLKFYIQVVEVLHYVSQKFNSLPLSFFKEPENALAFLHILLTSRKNNKNYFLKDQNLFKTLPLLKQLSLLCTNTFV